MSFYQGPELAQLRQAALLEEAANEHFARLAREGQTERAGDRTTTGRVIAVVTIALVVLAVAAGFDSRHLIEIAGRSSGRG